MYLYLSTHQNYKIDPILKLCQEYKINDASAYLLERTGDSQGALDLILATLEQRIEEYVCAVCVCCLIGGARLNGCGVVH